MKTLDMPHVTTLAQLFDKVSATKSDVRALPWEVDDVVIRTGRLRKVTIPIGTYVSVKRGRDYSRFYATPSAELGDFVRRSMISGGANDEISFEIIEHGDGTCLVLAKNNTIIGSRWLCRLPVSEISGTPRAA